MGDNVKNYNTTLARCPFSLYYVACVLIGLHAVIITLMGRYRKPSQLVYVDACTRSSVKDAKLLLWLRNFPDEH